MTFKPATWFPIAVVLSALNVIAVGFPAPVMPLHAMIHGALAVAFGLWAQRLRRSRGGSESEAQLEETDAKLEALEADMNTLRQQLTEAQERIDFAERLLARGPEKRRVGPEE